MALGFAEKTVLNTHEIVYTVRAYDGSGRPCYFLVQTNHDGAKAISSAIEASRNIELSRHGTVLAKGWGHDVPADVLAHIASQDGMETYGARSTQKSGTH